MGPRFIWDGLDVEQPPLRQTKDGCSFAATARQLEYQMRIGFAQSTSYKLPNSQILLHKEWENLLKQKEADIDRWKPWELLKQADKMFKDKKGAWVNRTGCPGFNNLPHFLKERYFVNLQCDNVEKVKNMAALLSKSIPVIAIIDPSFDYSEYANKPYIGREPSNSPESKIYRAASSYRPRTTHAVVIVGEYIAEENDRFGLKPDTYWLYQDSLQPINLCLTSPPKSLFPNLISILHPRLVIEAYFGKFTVPKVMLNRLSKDETDKIKYNINDKLRTKLKAKIDLQECLETHSKEREAKKKRR